MPYNPLQALMGNPLLQRIGDVINAQNRFRGMRTNPYTEMGEPATGGGKGYSPGSTTPSQTSFGPLDVELRNALEQGRFGKPLTDFERSQMPKPGWEPSMSETNVRGGKGPLPPGYDPVTGELQIAGKAPGSLREGRREWRSGLPVEKQMLHFLEEMITKKNPGSEFLRTESGKYWISQQRQRWLAGDDIEMPMVPKE